jgi:hypothetical protein
MSFQKIKRLTDNRLWIILFGYIENFQCTFLLGDKKKFVKKLWAEMTSKLQNQQKKPIVEFRKLLQERSYKVNPRRKLAKDETTKLAKLKGIAKKLKRGENVLSESHKNQ